MNTEKKNLRNKNVLITGINGFIGGNLAKFFVDNGSNVYGIVRNNSLSNFLHYHQLHKKVTLIHGDILDKNLLERVISEGNINFIFHLAAQVEVGVGIENPYLTFDVNVRGTYTLLESARLHKKFLEAVVVASTDKAYGSYSEDEMPYKENYSLKPEFPYDTSKACADMIARAYSSDLFELPIVVTRFSNIYGPGQLNFSALVPDAVRSALGYSDFIPRGNGQQVRDFLFVDDVVALYVKIAEELSSYPSKFTGEVYNAGTNTPTLIRNVIKQIFYLTSNEKKFSKILAIMNGKQTVGEIETQFMDFEKVNRDFGWSPSHDLNEGLRKTIEWYKLYFQKMYY